MTEAILNFSELRAPDIATLVKISRNLDRPGVQGVFAFLIPVILDGIFHKVAPQVFEQNVIAVLQREDMTFQQVAERKQLDRAVQCATLGLVFLVLTKVMPHFIL